jgi:hypothetical protein
VTQRRSAAVAARRTRINPKLERFNQPDGSADRASAETSVAASRICVEWRPFAAIYTGARDRGAAARWSTICTGMQWSRTSKAAAYALLQGGPVSRCRRRDQHCSRPRCGAIPRDRHWSRSRIPGATLFSASSIPPPTPPLRCETHTLPLGRRLAAVARPLGHVILHSGSQRDPWHRRAATTKSELTKETGRSHDDHVTSMPGSTWSTIAATTET